MERTGNVFAWCDVCGPDNDKPLVDCGIYIDECNIEWTLCDECAKIELEVELDEV